MLGPFRITRPSDLDSAFAAFDHNPDESVIYAGGTELLQAMKHGFLFAEQLVDIKGIPGFGTIQHDEEHDCIRIGAHVTHQAVETSPLVRTLLPVLADMERGVANVRVRNVGTLAGNLCFAEPHSDPAVLLTALDAEVVLESSDGTRVIGMDDFIIDAYATELQAGEILTEIRIPLRNIGSGCSYLKFGVYERPTIGVAVIAKTRSVAAVDSLRVVVGSVGPKPVRILEAEALFGNLDLAPLVQSEQLREVAGSSAERTKGLSVDVALSVPLPSELQTLVDDAGEAAAAAIDPFDDLYGSPDYKRHLARVFVMRGIHQSLVRAALGSY